MGSIRKIDFGPKGDPIIIEWNTGKLNTLVYDPTAIADTFDDYIIPEFYNFGYSNRREIRNTVRDLLSTGKFDDMNKFINLLVALRTTTLANGYEAIRRVELVDDLEKKMFWNIAWHLNHNPKQFYKYCYIQAYDYNGIKKFISFMTAEVDDRDVYYDTIYEKDKKSNKELAKKIKAKKKAKKNDI